MLLLAVSGAAHAAGSGGVLHGCESADGYPPFTFFEQDRKPRGYTVDLLKAALEGTGFTLDVQFLPSRRCDAAMDAGLMDLDMEDPWTEDYAAGWLISSAIWEATDALFYDRTRFPSGLSFDEIRLHPEQHHGCGRFADLYDEFAAGQIDTRSYTFEGTFTSLLRGACEFVPETVEFGAAYRFKGQKLLEDGRIGFLSVPLEPEPAAPLKHTADGRYPFYIYLRHDLPGAPALLVRLNQTIASWRTTGHDHEVMGKYIDLTLLKGKRAD